MSRRVLSLWRVDIPAASTARHRSPGRVVPVLPAPARRPGRPRSASGALTMTTTNGGSLDKSRIVEHRDGIVERANERGVKLATDADYKNFSKYADPPIAAP